LMHQFLAKNFPLKAYCQSILAHIAKSALYICHQQIARLAQ
jgi:hypothetical protein